MLKIYIAGFDVFAPDAVERGKRYKQICEKYGFEGLYPFDNEINCKDLIQKPRLIFEGNVNYIEQADIIVANLNPFRGAEVDSGTAFECGVGFALGKKLYGHLWDDSPIIDKVMNYYSGITLRKTTWRDREGYSIEDFGLPLNLMLAVPVKLVTGDFEDCIEEISQK